VLTFLVDNQNLTIQIQKSVQIRIAFRPVPHQFDIIIF
jgi:hypothetical protein